jgi:amino acid transporter
VTDTATVDQQPELKRVMGPGLLLLFIVGDILGTGVYALTGDVAAEVGGAAWLPFLVAFLIAVVTAFSYLELVTRRRPARRSTRTRRSASTSRRFWSPSS